ncbi:MAG: hypothetical protein ACXVR1_06755 [Solirubrobacteraceae bacterium]
MGRLITFGHHHMPATTSSHKLLVWALAGVAVLVAAVVVVAAVVATTGRGGTPRGVGLPNIPLLAGTRVVARVRSCDRGINPYCALQVVVVGDRYPSSTALRAAYGQQLAKLGWTSAKGPDGNETAVDSPGHELRLTYATAYEDLLGVDSNWIQRTAAISHSLSTTMFDRAPALSIMLVRGPS